MCTDNQKHGRMRFIAESCCQIVSQGNSDDLEGTPTSMEIVPQSNLATAVDATSPPEMEFTLTPITSETNIILRFPEIGTKLPEDLVVEGKIVLKNHNKNNELYFSIPLANGITAYLPMSDWC